MALAEGLAGKSRLGEILESYCRLEQNHVDVDVTE
jgi:hypothetical protein